MYNERISDSIFNTRHSAYVMSLGQLVLRGRPLSKEIGNLFLIGFSIMCSTMRAAMAGSIIQWRRGSAGGAREDLGVSSGYRRGI